MLNAADPEPPSVAVIGALIAAHLSHLLRAALDLGWRPVVTYGLAVGATCAWLVETAGQGDWRDRFPDLARYPWDLFDYAAEGRFLGGLSRAGDPC